jgi:hypothetical protein
MIRDNELPRTGYHDFINVARSVCKKLGVNNQLRKPLAWLQDSLPAPIDVFSADVDPMERDSLRCVNDDPQ